MTITILIKTYRRPKDLARCLESLKSQVRLPDEVVVVVRDTDTETQNLLADIDPEPLRLRMVTVNEPGTVAALNTGLDASEGDIVAFTDDDAVPWPDWLARIEEHFQRDPELGGVGGRDWIRCGEQVNDGSCEVVGKIQWFGRIIANHHLGVGESREVDVLKGVNMSYRREAFRGVRFDERLIGSGGVQRDEDYLFCVTVKRMGWKLIYEPTVAVDHYQTPRPDGDYRPAEEDRSRFSAAAVSDRVHNRTLMLLEHFSTPRQVVFLLWSVLVGSRDAFGVVQCLRFLPDQGTLAREKLLASLNGRLKGWRTWRRGG
ncbi:MAG: glycosyltransferase [Rubrobacteraceae bacterium]